MIREMLLFMESGDQFAFFLQDIVRGLNVGPTEDPQTVIGHILLLKSGGYLEESQRNVYRVTWAGHEMLNDIRDPEIWRKTKEGAQIVGSWSVKLLADLAAGYVKAKAVQLGLPIA